MLNDSQQLICCPECNCSVRFDRLERHLWKVHNGESSPKKQKPASSTSLKREKVRQVSTSIDSWLMRYKNYLYSSNNVKTLTIMAFVNFVGYGFEEINQFYNGKIDRERYEVRAKYLKLTYEQMVEHLNKSLIRHSRHYIEPSARSQYYARADNSDGCADWYGCNSIDRMGGSKYIGYYRREYEGSRFGSFPVHDDYGEESWADDNPWE